MEKEYSTRLSIVPKPLRHLPSQTVLSQKVKLGTFVGYSTYIIIETFIIRILRILSKYSILHNISKTKISNLLKCGNNSLFSFEPEVLKIGNE